MRTIGDGVGPTWAGGLTLAMMTTHGALDRAPAHPGPRRVRGVRQRRAPARRRRLRGARPRAAVLAPAGPRAAARLLALVLGRVRDRHLPPRRPGRRDMGGRRAPAGRARARD